MKKIIFLLIVTIFCSQLNVFAEEVELTATSAILMDAVSGTVLYEKNSDEKMPPASITKIMTMLLVMEEVDKGNINLEDMVTVSSNAAIKTGSHVYLAENEQITVNDLLKAVAVASANDGAIALAEHISGTQEAFVEKMNKKAKELNMNNTHFVNSNGLDAENHYSSARDIAIMTKELLKHKKIFDYTTIWMDTLRNGTFDLANTNKLIRYYEGAHGMKTGSTSGAVYCISATAERNKFQLIAVVMNSETTKKRFADASNLLNYGFNKYTSQRLNGADEIYKYVSLEKGVVKTIPVVVKNDCFVTVKNEDKSEIKSETRLPEFVKAPIKKGDLLGCVTYTLRGKTIAKAELVSGEDVNRITVRYAFKEILKHFAVV